MISAAVVDVKLYNMNKLCNKNKGTKWRMCTKDQHQHMPKLTAGTLQFPSSFMSWAQSETVSRVSPALRDKR